MANLNLNVIPGTANAGSKIKGKTNNTSKDKTPSSKG
jgi:hypothetical protein